MRFLDRSTCEQLVKLGLKSESNHYWNNDHVFSSIESFEMGKWNGTPAFTLSDFLETEEYAKENCRLLWPGAINIFDDPDRQIQAWLIKRNNLIGNDWIEYIKKALEERVR